MSCIACYVLLQNKTSGRPRIKTNMGIVSKTIFVINACLLKFWTSSNTALCTFDGWINELRFKSFSIVLQSYQDDGNERLCAVEPVYG